MLGIKTQTFKAEIIPRTSGFHLRGLGSNLCVNKNQELSLTGYNENLQGGLLCLYSLTCGKPSSQELCISRLFQSPVITEKKKNKTAAFQTASCQGKGRPFPWDTVPMAQRRKQSPKDWVFQDTAEEHQGRDFLVQHLSHGTSAGSHWNHFRREISHFSSPGGTSHQ